MKLIEYLPLFLRDFREYKEIFNVEDKEIEKLQLQVENILKEVIVNTAQSYGLDRYEKIYGIQNNTTDVETRRFTILSKINNRLPYSLNWLINKLNNTVGKDNYILEVDNNNYKVTLQIAALFNDIALLLNKDLREQLPANLIIEIVLFQTEECHEYYAGIVHTGEFIEIRQVV